MECLLIILQITDSSLEKGMAADISVSDDNLNSQVTVFLHINKTLAFYEVRMDCSNYVISENTCTCVKQKRRY